MAYMDPTTGKITKTHPYTLAVKRMNYRMADLRGNNRKALEKHYRVLTKKMRTGVASVDETRRFLLLLICMDMSAYRKTKYANIAVQKMTRETLCAYVRLAVQTLEKYQVRAVRKARWEEYL